MTLSLRPYQEAGRDFLAGSEAALLADDMRLGKCAQSISAARKIGATLLTVVCPASVCETWRREFRKWWPGGDYDLQVWSYDMAARGKAHRWTGIDILILDEAHYLKSSKAKRTQAIFGKKCDGADGLVAQADRVWLLTGTPMPNNPSELWPMLRALAPERILSPRTGKPWNLWQFVNKFCKTEYNPHAPQTPRIIGAKNHDALAVKLDGFMLRRTMAEVKPEVPPLQVEPLYLEGALPKFAACSPEIEVVRKALAEDGVDGLRKVAAHVATLRRYTGLAKVEPVVRWVKDWLDGGGRKIVLMAQHVDVIAGLCEAFPSDHALIRGSGTSRGRQASVDAFHTPGGPRVFIGQLQAAGTGIDLSAARDVLFVESSWVPAENAQAANRIVSVQDPQPRIATFATLAGSIDEDIQEAVRRKTADILRIVG
ncbi:DEAD/DEAH box helicase [Methyloceanibacter caenitepidi]|uniref:Superfamily II DNA/RNA helicases, SNF2 family n=1 Tax=Methyloceanibacter caenitepidi TaxID=1384459 RepID=A0A0A8JZS8_9HYPH|nr:DEAD/DEAH box helicase [Methyloceanibacter caenitepidi]BAQ16075.1 superfamily II DNA/RNA helicases, SNF2 family [Methyloceanibacter caenitepidi]